MRSSGPAVGDLGLRFNADHGRVEIRLSKAIDPPNAVSGAPRYGRGGLSGWQQKRVSDYIDAHLGEAVRLAALAELVDLSPFHFARAFKQSFGVPPHRYHVGRRIARAKQLLDGGSQSVTEIARDLGFAETSSFSATFRRVTGTSPMGYRRERP